MSPSRLKPTTRGGKRRETAGFPAVPAPSSGDYALPLGTIMRTRRLLIAALRVWELKHGIRDWPCIFPVDR